MHLFIKFALVSLVQDLLYSLLTHSLHPVTVECSCHSFLVRLTSTSSTVSCWDLPVTPEIQMGIEGITTGVYQCILEYFITVGLMRQTIGSTQFQLNPEKSNCPFNPSFCGQGPCSPSTSFHYSLLVIRIRSPFN